MTKPMPAAMAGRASGSPTRRKAASGVQPSVRLTSSAHIDCSATQICEAAEQTSSDPSTSQCCEQYSG